MENIHFTNEAIAGLITQGALMMIIPVILVIIWKKKTHTPMMPIFIGGAVWLVFAIILKLAPAYFLSKADNPVAKTISGNIWYTMITAGVLAGVFEETGRYIAFKTVLKKFDTRITSLSYGIGHGGFESVYVGFQIITIAVMGIMINNGMGDQLTAGADKASLDLMTEQLGQQSQLTLTECLLGVFERITAIAAHISFSVIVFAAARNRKYLYLYPLAILLHSLMDFSTVLYSAGLVNTWVMELILTMFTAIISVFAYRIYRNPDIIKNREL